MKIWLTTILVLLIVGCSATPTVPTIQQKEVSTSPIVNLPIQAKYNVTQQDLLAFHEALRQYYSTAQIQDILVWLDQMAPIYPQGYQTIILVTKKSPQWFKHFYEGVRDEETFDLLVHEMTHAGSTVCFRYGDGSDMCPQLEQHPDTAIYLFGNRIVSIAKTPGLFTKEALRSEVSTFTEIDKTYLNADNGDLYDTLDELNAYIESVEVEKVIQDPFKIADARNSLQRQQYHVLVYLKHLHEKEPEQWKEVVANKATVYLAAYLMEKAQIELTTVLAVSGEKEFDAEYTSTITEVVKEYAWLRLLLKESNLEGINAYSYVDPALQQKGILIDVIDLQ